MTNSEVIQKANLIHNNFYDYSLFDYQGMNIKTKIICPIHGVFEQTPNNHIHNKQVCLKCCNSKKTLTKEKFIERSNVIYDNFYDYSLVVYKNCYTKVKIICPIHGIFMQTPNAHLAKNKCLKCSYEEKRQTLQEFINKANIIHDNFYDYSLVNNLKPKYKIKIICPNHEVFKQLPSAHLAGNGCPKCKSSKGEIKIRNFLIDNNINFKEQYKFKKCRNQRVLIFDFYLTDLNICIEFDGIQHFKSISYFSGEKGFKKTKINDLIKTNYCKENNIKLIRINYLEFNNIINILNNELNI